MLPYRGESEEHTEAYRKQEKIIDIFEFDNLCSEAVTQCPQAYDGYTYIDCTYGDDMINIEDVIRNWRYDELLWDKGYCEFLDEEVLEIFDNIEEHGMKWAREYFKNDN